MRKVGKRASCFGHRKRRGSGSGDREFGIFDCGFSILDLKEYFLYEKHNVRVIRVDSGGTLNGVLLREGLVSEVSLLIHPCLVGGTSQRSFFRADDLISSEGLIKLELTHEEKLKDGVLWLIYSIIT